jgi:hypothetical protein
VGGDAPAWPDRPAGSAGWSAGAGERRAAGAAQPWPYRRGAPAGSEWPQTWEAGRVRAVDAAARVRAQLAGRRDPVRRHERRKRWTRRSVVARGVATVGLAWVTMHVDPAPGIEFGEVFWGTATVIVGAGAVGAGRRLWQLERTSPPVAPPRPAPLPPAGSAARGALERLAERERVLADLLAHLGPAADDPRTVAADAAAALRTHGTRVAAVEAARRGAPPDSRAGLDAAVAVLTRQLDEGVAGYDALVVAAADAVSASATLQAGEPVLAQRLADATDTLAGLAQGLREVAG